MALLTIRRALTDGNRSLILAALMAWVDWNQMKTAMTTSQSQENEDADERSLTSANKAIATASARPAQAAAIVAEYCLPVSFQTPALKIRPPSSGSPGSRLKMPTNRFAKKSWEISWWGRPLGMILASS